MGREEDRGQGLDNLQFIGLGSRCPHICDEGQGGEEARGHWTKVEVTSWCPVAHRHMIFGGQSIVKAFTVECQWKGHAAFGSWVLPPVLIHVLPKVQAYSTCLARGAVRSGPSRWCVFPRTVGTPMALMTLPGDSCLSLIHI